MLINFAAFDQSVFGCNESRADVARLVADEITELSPLNVVWMASTDGGRGGRVGRCLIAVSS